MTKRITWRAGYRVATFCLFFLSATAVGPVTNDPIWAEEPPSKETSSERVTPTNQAPKKQSVEEVARAARDAVVVISVTGRDGEQLGLGSGFILSAEGHIATNLHVIGEARPIRVTLADGTKLNVKEVHASDRNLDLAILRVDPAGKKLKTLSFGDPKSLSDGAEIVVVGNPHGLKHSVVSGVLSGRREIEGRQMLQLAIPIEPGNSGGPVLDRFGQVHGVVTMKSAITNNLGFAVDARLLRSLVEKPNPIPMTRWLTIGALDVDRWKTLFGAQWQQRAGRILVRGAGSGFGGRSLALDQAKLPKLPYEVAVSVRMNDDSGAAGLVFHSDGANRHYGFYPSNGRLRLTCFQGPSVFSWQVLQEIRSEHYQAGDWNHLKVRLTSDKIECYLNGHLAMESNDRTLTNGAIGLAKFRDTTAEFKQFAFGKKLAQSRLSVKQRRQVETLIDSITDPSAVTPQQNDQLIAEASASTLVLRDRATQLERQAIALRRLADDVHVAAVAKELRELVQQEKTFDLLHAALLIARLDNAELEPEPYLQEVDRMANEIRAKLRQQNGADSSEKDSWTALNEYLFQENGFHGSRSQYYHRANSYMNRVIDDREGLPITLSVLYMELAARLDLKMEGVALPGHFVVRYLPKKGESHLLDIYDSATVLDRKAVEKLVRERAGARLREKHLVAATSHQIVERMLRNLLGISQREKDHERMLRYLDALVAMNEEDVAHRGMRAIVRQQAGRHDDAIRDLDWFLEHKPDGLDLNRIRQMKEAFLQEGR